MRQEDRAQRARRRQEEFVKDLHRIIRNIQNLITEVNYSGKELALPQRALEMYLIERGAVDWPRTRGDDPQKVERKRIRLALEHAFEHGMIKVEYTGKAVVLRNVTFREPKRKFIPLDLVRTTLHTGKERIQIAA